MKLIPLGVNGYLPIRGRHSSCFLVLCDDAAFLLDAGTGAARLHEPAVREMLEPYDDVHLLLSHYHVDHTVGLYYAFTALRGKGFHIHAPVCPFMSANPEEAVTRYFSPPLNSYELKDTEIEIHPINNERATIAGHEVSVWPQQHPGGSVGLRIENHLAYVTDTVVLMDRVEKVAGVSLLLHELWLNEEDAARQSVESRRHACFAPVVEFVKAARPERVMPVHLYPHYTDEQIAGMTRDLAAQSGVPAEVPVEGAVYDIPAPLA